MTVRATTTPRLRPRYYTPKLTYRLIRLFTTAIMHLLYRWDVKGRENVPASGATLVIVNHLHLLDPFAVAPQVSRQIVTIVASKWAANWAMRTFLNAIGVIYIRRGEVDREALRAGLEVLGAGRVLAMAPEGTRSRTGRLQEAKSGTAYLALRTNTVIVPVACWGIERLREWRPFRRPLCHVAIGKPFRLPRPEGKLSSDALPALTDLLMVQLGRLLPESYRGVYAERIAAYEAGERTGPDILPA